MVLSLLQVWQRSFPELVNALPEPERPERNTGKRAAEV